MGKFAEKLNLGKRVIPPCGLCFSFLSKSNQLINTLAPFTFELTLIKSSLFMPLHYNPTLGIKMRQACLVNDALFEIESKSFIALFFFRLIISRKTSGS